MFDRRYTGVCNGGPYDGHVLIWTESTREVCGGPWVDFPIRAGSEVRSFPKGTYFCGADGTWFWVPVK
jgi:hypothetical protein